ncbi:hypothetical protein JXD20_04475 [Candidatus Peregrinibacteria bacterium]|nr:hypothetical protein [Candidatus Peregrinibacteria bacterium]
MYHVARTLVALSHKGILISLVVTFVVLAILGHFVNRWIFIVPFGLMCLRMVYMLVTVLRSASRIGWGLTFGELFEAIQQVRIKLAVEKAKSQTRLNANRAKLRGEPHLHLVDEPPDDEEPKKSPPKLGVINGGDK